MIYFSQVKNLEKLHSNMRDASRASYRLQRESACALQDLKAVTQVERFFDVASDTAFVTFTFIDFYF